MATSTVNLLIVCGMILALVLLSEWKDSNERGGGKR